MEKGIEVHGLDDFRKGLRSAGGKWPSELGKVHRTLAREVAAEARAFARGTGGSTAHFAGSVYGLGSTKKASIGVRSQANAAFWGAKKNTGWNRRAKPGSKPQHPRWVGNSWDVGGPGGPLAINPAIRHDLDKIDRRYSEMVRDLARRAFPD